MALRRSALTPDELSPLKKMRSPAREAIDVMMSASYSLRHCVYRSSICSDRTMPSVLLRRSIVARSMTM